MLDDVFLSEALENPDDDACRLIWADWLEERGDPRSGRLRLASEVWRLASKARTPPFGSGDLWGAESRLSARSRSNLLPRLWTCACVRFLPLSGERKLAEELPLPLRRWVTATELATCGLPVPEELSFGSWPIPEEIAPDDFCRYIVNFVRGDLITRRFFFAEVGWLSVPVEDLENSEAVALRQAKQARRWCFRLAQRLLKLPLP